MALRRRRQRDADPAGAGGMMAGLVMRQFVTAADLPEAYGTAFDACEKVALDQGLHWYRNLNKTVFADGSVRFIVAERDGLPLAILPLRLATGTDGRREVVALGNYYTWLYGPVADGAATARVYADMLVWLRRALAPVDVLYLAPMDPAAASFAALEGGLRVAGWKPFRYFCFGNWYLDVAGRNWTDYLQSRGSELRNTLRRKGNKFIGDGGTLEIVTDGAAVEETLAAYQSIYAASWKNQEPHPEFIPGLVRTAAAEGWLRLGIARLAGVPVAAQIWLVAHGTANIYKLAYDESYSAYSAGTLLTAHLMRHVMDVDHVTTVDFLSGDDTYKPTWMSGRRERWGIVAYNPRTIKGLSGLIHELAGRSAKSLLARVRRRQA